MKPKATPGQTTPGVNDQSESALSVNVRDDSHECRPAIHAAATDARAARIAPCCRAVK
jgi:hypothetical protein